MKEGIYSGLDAEFYDELLEGEMDDLQFWDELLKSNGGTALEVGCGTGRILMPLVQQGHVVDGMDNSKRMVALLKEKASHLNLEVDDTSPQHMISLFHNLVVRYDDEN